MERSASGTRPLTGASLSPPPLVIPREIVPLQRHEEQQDRQQRHDSRGHHELGVLDVLAREIGQSDGQVYLALSVKTISGHMKSFQALMKTKIASVTSTGAASGRITDQ